MNFGCKTIYTKKKTRFKSKKTFLSKEMTHKLGNNVGVYGEYYKGRKYTERAFSKFLDIGSQTLFDGLGPNSSILEICCGEDYLFDHMPPRVQETFGSNWIHLDRDEEVIARNRSNHPDRTYKIGNVLELTDGPDPIKPDSIDVVLCSSGLDQVRPPYLPKAARQIHSVLRKGRKVFHILDLIACPEFFYEQAILEGGYTEVPVVRKADTPEDAFPYKLIFGFVMFPPQAYRQFLSTLSPSEARLIERVRSKIKGEIYSQKTKDYHDVGEIFEQHDIGQLGAIWVPCNLCFTEKLVRTFNEVFSEAGYQNVPADFMGEAREFQEVNRVYYFYGGFLNMDFTTEPDDFIDLKDGSRVRVGDNVFEQIDLDIAFATK